MKKENSPEIPKIPSLAAEIKRKAIHLLMIVIPIWIYFTPHRIALFGLIIATVFTVILDILRLSDDRLKSFFLKLFKSLIRRHEEAHLLGSTYLMISALLSVLVFEKSIAISALSFLVLGDTAAAVIGRRYGRSRYWGKSIEGSFACFTVCLVIGLTILESPWIGLAGAISATVAEALPVPMDDNMRIPIVSGLVMQLADFFS